MHRTYTVTEIRDENYRTKTLVLDRALIAKPGQFAMVWLPGVDERPFSIAAASPLTLTVVAVGPFSERLHQLGEGERLWVRGPLGQPFELPAQPSGKRLVMVGGGYGVAPLRFLAREALTANAAVEVCIGARTAADVLLAERLVMDGAVVRVMTEDGSRGGRGLVTAALEAAVLEARPASVYACGPVPMLEAVESRCLAHGLPYQLSWEARMRCGMGLCGTCEVHGRRREGWLACSDGPVSVS